MIKEPDIKSLPIVKLEIPNGERPDEYLENYLGTLPTSAGGMPSEEDTEATVFIEFK